jgi:hypothetical protein
MIYKAPPLAMIVFFALTFSIHASTYLEVGDSSYVLLQRLEGEGVISSALLATKPLSRHEIARLLTEAEASPNRERPGISATIAELRRRFPSTTGSGLTFTAVDTLYGRYLYADGKPTPLVYNNAGDEYASGSNGRLGLSGRIESPWLSLQYTPELRHDQQRDTVKGRELYAVLQLGPLDLLAGRISQWWGPGYHGATLLSNNADPFDQILLTNPQAIKLPWLGPFRFVAFATRLENDRIDVAHPYLWGIRLTAKPMPEIEVGVQRTAMLGGNGYSNGINTWWHSFTTAGEHLGGEAGDQRGSVDLKLTLPFEVQPLQLYGEVGAEDSRHGAPYKYAYLGGLFLTRLAGLRQLQLRGEIANNHVSGRPNVWYNHHRYFQGYSYRGEIIGHHMGSDSRDYFAEVSWLFPDDISRLTFSYDHEHHNLSFAPQEEKSEYNLSALFLAMPHLEVSPSWSFARLSDEGNRAGQSRKLNLFSLEARYRF